MHSYCKVPYPTLPRGCNHPSVQLGTELADVTALAPVPAPGTYIAAGDGHHDEALALLKEAGAIAEASGAHRITRQVEESRARL